MSYQRRPVKDGWTFVDPSNPSVEPLPTAQSPTVIHLDLLSHDLIPDPTKDRNSELIQWIGEKQWRYSTTFRCKSVVGAKNILVFDGLDTYATITVDGKEVAKTSNMFLQYRVDVTSLLDEGEDHTLELLFDSALLTGKRLEKKQGFKNLFWNGDSCRMNVRKIGCHFGWDWAPTLLTSGPWRDIWLEMFTGRIVDVNVDANVADDLQSATVTIHCQTEGKGEALVQLYTPQGIVIHSQSGTGQVTIEQPQLWWPTGNGAQPLYTIPAKFGGHVITRRIGIRHLRLVQRPVPDVDGTSFFFQVNNVPIFCRGTNWVPGDTFLPRLTTDRYTQWLDLAKSCHQNMVRVWGGGTFEADGFYDECDRLGIMIWHDFMLGCGAYPVNDFMLETIEAEARHNLKRLRHHPSIVLWCGNNEDHMFAELHHLEYEPKDEDPQNWLKSNWPARIYYDKILKELCEELVPRIPYHNSSPFGGKWSNDPTVGDVHAWNVWMADQPRKPYQEYASIRGRFVSEFGMKSMPSFRTIEKLISDPKERHPQSRTMDNWHCAPEDQRTLQMYLIDNQRYSHNIESYVYATQLNQAEAMSYACRAFRRAWKGQGREECAGSLIWQLNDCFPSVSWSLADCFLRPKLAFYTATRAYSPIMVSVERIEEKKSKNQFTNVHIDTTTFAEVWASNLTTETVVAELSVSWHTLGGDVKHSIQENVALSANGASSLKRNAYEADWGDSNDLVVLVKLSGGDRILSRHVDFPQPLRHNDYSTTVRLSAEMYDYRNLRVRVNSDRVAKGVELYIEDTSGIADRWEFDDNCLDLVPGEEMTVLIRNHGDDLGQPQVGERHYMSL